MPNALESAPAVLGLQMWSSGSYGSFPEALEEVLVVEPQSVEAPVDGGEVDGLVSLDEGTSGVVAVFSGGR